MSRSLLMLPLLLSLAACDRQQAKPGPQIAVSPLQLNWYAGPQHGGCIAAATEPLGGDHGVIGIENGGPNVPVEQRVATGQVLFGVTNADMVLVAREAGAPLVALLAPMQRSPRCILVHPESGVTQLQELGKLKTLAVSQKKGFTMLLRARVDLAGVELVKYGGVAPLLARKDYGTQGYSFSEPFACREQGLEPRVLMVRELGFDPYTSLLVTSERVIKERPELVRAVVAAVSSAWQRYLGIGAPADAALIERTHGLIKKLNPNMSAAQMDYAREALIELCQPPAGQPFGAMSRERWQALADALVEVGKLSAAPDVGAAFDNGYLPR